jgi:hypothetical protein
LFAPKIRSQKECQGLKAEIALIDKGGDLRSSHFKKRSLTLRLSDEQVSVSHDSDYFSGLLAG